jgi:NADPH-dependent glutamate synthase beta subunit-like oxidoreductase
MPRAEEERQAHRVARRGPASLAVARDLLPLGYEVHMFEKDPGGGGSLPRRSRRSASRWKCWKEVELILNGRRCHFGHVTSMKAILDEGFDAYFVGTGTPRTRPTSLRAQEAARTLDRYQVARQLAFGHHVDQRQSHRDGRR